MSSSIKKIDELTKNNKVVIFSKSFCPYCNQVKKVFTDLNEPFVALELDLLGDEGTRLQSALYEKTKQKTVPNVFVNRHHIGGCDSTLKALRDGTLQDMLNGAYVVYDYDLVVIGGGSGGLAASKEAATLGKKVAVCDFVVPSPIGSTWGLGGTCVNVGCIPKKLMHNAALLGSSIKDAPYFGWDMPEKVDHSWSKMVVEIQQYIMSLNWGYRVGLKDKNVAYLNSYARFIDAHTLKITDKKNVEKTITADNVIIAVGGRPVYPDIPGAKECGITSDDLFSMAESPGKTLLIGASYIALECAGFLAGLGLDVTVMVRSILLRGFDRQMSDMIGDQMQEHGVKFIRECIPTCVEKLKDGFPGLYKVTGRTNSGDVVMGEYNTVVYAIGREACTKGIGLEAVGVEINKSNCKIVTSEGDKSSVDNIYAIGDVMQGCPELTPVAIQAGKLLARRLFGRATIFTDYTNVATTVFTPLEYGSVGLSEEDAIAKYQDANIEVYHSHFIPLEYSLSGREGHRPYAKMICVKNENEKIVGLHILSPNAGEVIQGYAIAMKFGATKADMSSLIGIHPTCAEIFTTLSITKACGEPVDKTSC